MSDRTRWAFVCLVLVVVLAVVTATLIEYRACDGRLVRGLVWWECEP